MSRWRVHCCLFDKQCREYGAPMRLHIFTPFGTLIMGARTQLWLPWKTMNPWTHKMSNYSRWWSPIVWDPVRKR